MQNPQHTDTKPWYKQPLVWLVIAIPGGTVIAGFITLGIALQTDDGTVVDDYYKYGKEINRVIVRDQKAAELGLVGTAGYDPENRRVSLTVASSKGLELPDSVTVTLLHATKGGFDVEQTLPLENAALSMQLSDGLARGPWVVRVSTPEWRISGRMEVPKSPATQLIPQI